MARGSASRSFWASSVKLHAHLMLYVRPCPRSSCFDLAQSVAHLLCFRGSEDVIGIHEAFRLDKHAVAFLAERHEIPLAHAKFVENLAGNDHLAALPHPADRFPW